MKIFKYSLLCVYLAIAGCEKEEPTPSSKVTYQLDYIEYLDSKTTMKYDAMGRISQINSVQTKKTDLIDIFLLSTDIQGSYNKSIPIGMKDQAANKQKTFHVYSKTIVNGNPVELKAIRDAEKWDPAKGTIHFWDQFLVKIDYDNKINPVYLVLEQSAMIPTIDDMLVLSPDLVYSNLEAKGAVAKNNPTLVKVYDSKNILINTVTIDYQYNAQDLPTLAIGSETQSTNKYLVKFFYKEKN